MWDYLDRDHLFFHPGHDWSDSLWTSMFEPIID